jgi:hypothetical protein
MMEKHVVVGKSNFVEALVPEPVLVVCSAGTAEEALAWANANSASFKGSEFDWEANDSEFSTNSDCNCNQAEANQARTHYRFQGNHKKASIKQKR